MVDEDREPMLTQSSIHEELPAASARPSAMSVIETDIQAEEEKKEQTQ